MKRSKPSPPATGGYRLHRQQIGTRITYWPDPRGPGHGEMYWGTVLEHMGETVLIGWDDDPEFYENWSSKECRYRVDRGQMRFIPPPKERRVRLAPDELICKTCGKPRQLKCGCPRPGALKPEHWGQKVDRALLTPSNGHDMMVISNEGNALNDTKGAMMAARKGKTVVAVEEVEEVDDIVEAADEVELEELDEATEPATASEGGEMLTAKAAASLLKTDGRTLRKFLRKEHGTIGQGQRWEVDPNDIDALRVRFEAWKGGAKDKADKTDKPKAPKSKATKADPIYDLPAADAELDELEEIEDLDFGDE